MRNAPTTITSNAQAILEAIAETLDIPPSYYQRAVERYRSLAEWLQRSDAKTAIYRPDVYAQGSFRLGLVNRPLLTTDEYDLDLVCELKRLSKAEITQQALKALLRHELELYRKEHRIEEELKEKKRCWRLDYADHLRFHIDNLPCVPEEQRVIQALIRSGVDPAFAKESIALTCKTHEHFAVLSPNWPMSNPSGYAHWFEGRFAVQAQLMRKQLLAAGTYNAIEKIPLYALKSPLQQSIQVLKRHRDVMFRHNPDVRPISVIITTLGAHAYQGEERLYDALSGMLDRMPAYVRQATPRVPNPVNPGEDFADKWGNTPQLEQNFWAWHQQALRDLEALATAPDAARLQRLAKERFGVALPADKAVHLAGTGGSGRATFPSVIVTQTPRPWGG